MQAKIAVAAGAAGAAGLVLSTRKEVRTGTALARTRAPAHTLAHAPRAGTRAAEGASASQQRAPPPPPFVPARAPPPAPSAARASRACPLPLCSA